MSQIFKKAQLVEDEAGSVFAASDSGRKLLKIGGYGGFAAYTGVAHTIAGNGANFSMEYSNAEGQTPLLDTSLKSPVDTGLYFVQLSAYSDLSLADFLIAPDLILQLVSFEGNSIFAYSTFGLAPAALTSPGSYPNPRGSTTSVSAMAHIVSGAGGALNPQVLRGADEGDPMDFYYNMTVVKLG
jgi:hypothetical protein